MRVLEDIVLEGHFWLPDKTDKKVSGRLTIKDKAEIRLEITDRFKSFKEELTGYHPERINGEVEKHGYVTLENCIFLNRSLSGTVSKSIISAQSLYLGVAYNEGENPTFNTFSFEIDCLNEWHGCSGFEIDLNIENHSASVAYQRPKRIDLWSNADIKLGIRFSWSSPGTPSNGKFEISENSYFHIESTKPRPISDFARIAHRISHLFSLAYDQTVAISNVRTTSESLKHVSANGTPYAHIIKVFYPALSHNEHPLKIHRFHMLFRMPDIIENSQAIFSSWFSAYDHFTPALNLYFSAQSGIHKFLDSRFLALVQALETYHRRTSKTKTFTPEEFELLRWSLLEATPHDYQNYIKGRLTHGNEPSLPARIREMLNEYADLFGSSKSRESLVRKVAAARNYYTHFDTSLENQVMEGIKFWQLCQKMDALMQLMLLKEVGFDSDKIRAIVAGSDRFKRKLRD